MISSSLAVIMPPHVDLSISCDLGSRLMGRTSLLERHYFPSLTSRDWEVRFLKLQQMVVGVGPLPADSDPGSSPSECH
jgi:hypothetical protein